MKRNKRVNRAIQALRAHKSYIGDLDADRWIRARVHDIGQDVGYQYAVNFRVIEI